jgi:hypothetical protein
LILAGFLFAVITSLTTCTDGIFAIIETEKKVVTSTLPLTISIYGVVTSVPAVPGGPYYVAAGAVYRGTLNPDGTMTWLPDNNSRPLNPSGNPMCIAMAFYAGELWGSFITSGGTLFKSSALSFAGQSPINDPAINGKQTGPLQVAGPVLTPRLFASSTVDTSTYELDMSLTGANWTGSPVLSGLSKPIAGVSYDGTNYWTASGTSIYKSLDPPSLGSFAAPAVNPVPSDDLVNGVFSSTGLTFLATKKNGIYWTSTAGLSWNHIDADQVGSNTVSYLCVAGPADAGDKYLVGSDGYGYYTLSISGNTLTRFDDSTIGLFSNSVANILVDGANIFMGTHANGLWRAKFDTGTGALASGESWVHE